MTTIAERNTERNAEPLAPEALVTSRRGLFKRVALASGAAAFAAATSTIAGDRPAPDGMARLNLRENPWGASKKAVEAVVEHAAYANRYAGDEKKALTDYIATTNGVTPEQVVLGNGSKPILAASGAWLARGGGDLVTADLTYAVLYKSAAAFGADLVQVPLTDAWDWDFDQMLAKIQTSNCGTYVCNPNGSTGRLTDPKELRAFVIEAAKTAPVFVDEAYLDMTEDFPNNSMVPLVAEGHNVVVSRTLSKLHGLAGQRLGYAMGNEDIIAGVQALLTNHVNRAGLVAGLASLQDTAFQTEMRSKIAQGRARLENIAGKYEMEIVNGSALNGVMWNVNMDVPIFHEKMLAQGVLVAETGRDNAPGWSSVCIGTDAEMDTLEAALASVMNA